MSFPLPAAQDRDHLKFHVLKGLSYNRRALVACILAAAGVMTLFLIPFPGGLWGAVPLLCAGVLLAGRGYTNKPSAIEGEGFWKATGVDRLEELIALHRKIRSWDRAALDITNGLGFIAFLGIILLTALLTVIAYGMQTTAMQRTATFAIPVCAAALFLPLWFIGNRAGHTNKILYQKLIVFRDLAAHFEKMGGPEEEIQAMLHLFEDGKDAVPQDAKLSIRWKNAVEEFYGIQAQVTLNDVQGTLYPYCYFVVVSDRSLEIRGSANAFVERGNIIIEEKVQSAVNVIVIRQYSTKTAGYHTKPDTCREIMEVAMKTGRAIAKKHRK